MPTYKIEVSEQVHRINDYFPVEIEAESLEDAMAQLAEEVTSPDFYWGGVQRVMMVLSVSVDDEEILADTRSSENGTLSQMWPEHMVEDGRVWEGQGDDAEYRMESMPRRVQDLIEDEEGKAE
jgi:hypothetical protein